LQQLATYRGWHIDSEHNVLTPHRGLFRFYAHTDTVRVAALFVDFATDVIRRGRFNNPDALLRSVSPKSAAIQTMIHLADTETVEVLGKSVAEQRTLIVLILHADAHQSLQAEAQHFVDEITLNREHAAVLYLEPWHIDELAIDVVAHSDVNVHRRASDDERRAYLVEHLPLMLMSDPVARWLGFREDDVVVEVRNDCDMGESKYLRRVVHRPMHASAAATAASVLHDRTLFDFQL